MFASLNIRPQERRPVLLLFLYSFFTGSASIFSYTAAYALFLSVFEESDLSYVFIAAAILSLFIGTWFARLEQIVSTKRLFLATVTVLLVSTIVLQVALWMDAGIWVFWAALVWYRLYYPLTNLSFWGVIGRVLDVQQGKRLFGFVSTGEDIARIIGYGTVPLVVSLVGVENLLLLNAITVLLMLGMLFILSPHISSVEEEEAPRESYTLLDLWGLFLTLFKERYIRLIFFLTFFTVLAYFIIDYGLYSAVQDQFPTPTSLAQFLGYFWMFVYTFSLFFRFFATNTILRRWGLFVGLLFLPIVFGILSFVYSLSTVFAAGTILILVTIGAIKFFEDSLSNTIHRSSSTLLYQPLPAKTTLSAQVVAESLVSPIGLGVAGVLLLIFNNLPFFNLMWLGLLLIVIGIVRVFLSREVFYEYVQALNRALSTRRLQGSLSDLEDSASLSVLESHLQSEDPATLIYTIDLLGKVAPQRIKEYLKSFLMHENDFVARAAVRSVGQLEMIDALPEVKSLAARQSPVSPEALYTMMALEKDAASPIAIQYLSNEDLNIVGQAIIGLIQFGSYANKGVGGQKLKDLANSKIVEERIKAAEICGHLMGEEVEGTIRQLMIDPSPSVQKQAVVSLIDNLRVFSLKSDLKAYENDPPLFNMIVNTMRISDGYRVTEELVPYLDHGALSSRQDIFRALDAHGYVVVNKEGREKVENELNREVKLAYWVSASLADLARESEAGLLQRALFEMIEDIRARIFFLLSFIYDKNLVNRIQDDLAKGDNPRQQALIVEALSNHLSAQHWDLVGPIIQEYDSKELWSRLRHSSKEPRMSYIDRVESIIMTPDINGLATSEWLRVTALFDLGSKKLSKLKDVVAFCAVHDDQLIRETAEWALGQLES